MNLRILMLSLDKNMVEQGSGVSLRILRYAQRLEILDIIVPTLRPHRAQLDHNVVVYGAAGASRIFQLWQCYVVATSLIKKQRYSVLTVQDTGYLGLLAWFLARRFNLGLELQIHGFEKYHAVRRFIACFLIKRASVVRVVSQRLKRQLIDAHLIVSENIVVVPIYTPEPVVDRNEVSIIREFEFVTVGRLVPIKRIDLQIRAIARLHKEGLKATLVLVGDGPERQKLEALAADLQVTTAVSFVGWQQNMASWYQRATGFLLTSDAEGWGRVAIEAAYYGVPIIMTDVGCAGEVFQDKISALIIPPNNSNALENAMRTLLQDTELAARLVAGAYTSVQLLPNQDQTIDMHIESWNRAAQKSL